MKSKKKKKKYNLGGLQQFQQPQQQSLVDSESEQQANALVSGVGAINPIVGAAMKIGQGVGAQTVNKDGIYGSRAGAVLDNSVNPTTGITNFKDLANDFSASTVANQLSAGLFGRSATQTRRKKELAAKQLKEQAATNVGLIQNSGLAHGGNLVSKKLKVVDGGSLTPISPDAVEVNATNPSQTDSVELTDAFVDNNEIIDNKNRVFSDVLTTPTGRTIAKEAKRLEKMKATSPRFNASNSRIDTKLNELFDYQEAIKQDNTRVVNKPVAIDPINTFNEDVDAMTKMQSFKRDMGTGITRVPFEERMNELNKELNIKAQFKLGGYVKPKPVYAFGGDTDPKRGGPRYDGNPLFQDTAMNTNNRVYGDSSVFYDESIDSTGYEKDPSKTNFNWGKAANTAATFAPNIVNAFLQRRLKGPAAPMLENEIKLDRIDPSAQLAEASRQANMANKLITANTAQGANLSSSIGSVLAKRLAANNNIYGQNQAINAQIQGREAQLNQMTRARNTERSNEFKNNQVAFLNKKLQMTSENVANASAKFQSMNREKNQMDLDRDRFNIIQSRFEDLPDEMKSRYSDVFDYYNSKRAKPKNNLGGKMKKASYKDSLGRRC